MVPIICLLLAIVGHFALHLAFYNRLNATGLRRKVIKASEVVFAIECIATPCIFLGTYLSSATDLPSLSRSLTNLPLGWYVYAGICVTVLVVLGVPWLLYRPIFRLEWVAVEKKIRHVDLRQVLQPSPIGSLRCRINAAIPLNQILSLSIEEKTIPVPQLPPALKGLRIAHLSDLHLTGDMLPNFYQYISEQVMEWKPDVVCLTGDIIDKADCIPWLQDCLGEIQAPSGCYFILGNHDTRVINPSEVREKMEHLGWVDVGGRSRSANIRDTCVTFLGNELPWFGPSPIVDFSDTDFSILLSHAPDQIQWARRHHVDLMLAGHTHGGHGRLPLIGPLLSPSWYGSRFASGEFYLKPTTLHVTRGIFGTHLQRINCPPELSLLTLC